MPPLLRYARLVTSCAVVVLLGIALGGDALEDADDSAAAAPFAIPLGGDGAAANGTAGGTSDDDDGWDSQGYVTWCPCMGHFGNQVDTYLGALVDAKRSNRTVALPPFVAYNFGTGLKTEMVPFDEYFRVDAVAQFHRVLTLGEFLKRFGEKRWPRGSRVGFCSMFFDATRKCGFNDGVPFSVFWKEQGIEFNDVAEMDTMPGQWYERLTPAKYPMVAMRDARGHYPVRPENRHMQRYIVWSDKIKAAGAKMMAELGFSLADGPLVTVHLRNGIDWVRACDRADTRPSFMSSPQCDHLRPSGNILKDECLPSQDHVVERVLEAVRHISARTVFVGTDSDAMLAPIRRALVDVANVIGPVRVVSPHERHKEWRQLRHRPQIEMHILGLGDLFIGNCVSSFSAFVARERAISGKPTWFFGVSLPGEPTSVH